MKKFKALLLSGLLVLGFLGCGGDKGEKEKVNTKLLTISQDGDAKTLDPHGTNDQATSRISTQIFDRLVEQDMDMNLNPMLAEKWEARTPTETVFYLKKGVKFHNGEELKATDVKFTFDRMANSPTVTHIVGPIKEVLVEDEYTVVVVTKYPFAPLLNHLAHPASSILNEKAVTAAGDNFGQNPVGTGPFIFEKWTVGDSIILKGNKNYYAGAPEIDTLVFKPIPEATNRYIGLETKELDVSFALNTMDKESIKTNKDINLVEKPSLSNTSIVFNTRKDIFKDKRVRQAIAYALDVTPIIENVWQGSASQADSPIGPKVFGYSSSKKYDHNIEKAKELLNEAGFPNGFDFTLWVNDDTAKRDLAIITQEQLRAVGINVVVDTLETGAYLSKISKGEHDAYVGNWFTVTGDADYGLYPLFHSKNHGSPGNRSFYSNPRVDELLEAGRSEADMEKRKVIYKEIQEILQEDLPLFTVAYISQNAGYNKSIKGFDIDASGKAMFRGVTKE